MNNHPCQCCLSDQNAVPSSSVPCVTIITDRAAGRLRSNPDILPNCIAPACFAIGLTDVLRSQRPQPPLACEYRRIGRRRHHQPGPLRDDCFLESSGRANLRLHRGRSHRTVHPLDRSSGTLRGRGRRHAPDSRRRRHQPIRHGPHSQGWPTRRGVVDGLADPDVGRRGDWRLEDSARHHRTPAARAGCGAFRRHRRVERRCHRQQGSPQHRHLVECGRRAHVRLSQRRR